jgi:hypothetical protein
MFAQVCYLTFSIVSLRILYYENIFTELGRFCRYESSSYILRGVWQSRASVLLVWKSADTTRKRVSNYTRISALFRLLH